MDPRGAMEGQCTRALFSFSLKMGASRRINGALALSSCLRLNLINKPLRLNLFFFFFFLYSPKVKVKVTIFLTFFALRDVCFRGTGGGFRQGGDDPKCVLSPRLQFNPSVDESTSIHATPREESIFLFSFFRHGNFILLATIAIIIREGEDTHENTPLKRIFFLFFFRILPRDPFLGPERMIFLYVGVF